MDIDYTKRRIVITEPLPLQRVLEEVAHLGLEEWQITGINEGSYFYGVAVVDDWETDVAG